MDQRRRRGIDATNRDFSRHDQVSKAQVYRLAEGGEEIVDDETLVHTCDLSRWLEGSAEEKRAFAEDLHASLRGIGFAVLEGHGIAPEVHAAAARQVPLLFEETALEDKLRFRAARHGSVNQGYFPIEETTDIHPDQVEGWVFCRRAFRLDESSGDASAYWPDAASEAVFRRLVEETEPLIVPVMQAILTGLGCNPHLYDDRLTRTNLGLRLNYYPPLEPRSDLGGAARLLGHEDVDLFTLLPAPEIEGLQAFDRTTKRWLRLHAPPGSLILNTGDYLQRISNDLLPSTTHRVSPPRSSKQQGRPRVSFPLNVYLWEDEILEVLRGLGEPHYAPVRAIEFHTRATAKYYGDDHAVSGSAEAGDTSSPS